jgi:hypothetical protein
VKNVASSDAKWVDVSAGRFPGWIDGFAVRHGGPVRLTGPAGGAATCTASDGAVAECHPPFTESFTLPTMADGRAVTEVPAVVSAIAAHAAAPRTVGVLLVRLGGYAAGVFTGYPPALGAAKVGSRPVHGRSAAGGWSQQRFARRREKQANEALEAAANAAVLVFAGGVSRARVGRSGTVPNGEPAPALDAVVLGGDKRAVAELRADPRLAPYFALATMRFLTVPDPKRAVLEATPKTFTAVRISITEPAR